MAEGSDIGYSPGNISDQFKHSNLEQLISYMNPAMYFEFHSGEGKYSDYEGSALRALRMMRRNRNDYFAFLHEIREDAREKLRKNVQDYPDATVRDDWRKYAGWYISIADETALFMFDPAYIGNYSERNGLLYYIDPILKTGASLFMYLPETPSRPSHRDIVNNIKNKLKKSKICYVDLAHPAGNGCFMRSDHNIIAAKKHICRLVLQRHNLMHIKIFGKKPIVVK